MDIEVIKRKLLLTYPFFGRILANTEFVEHEAIGTAATDGDVIYYNPKFVEALTPDERTFLFAHEVGHIAFNHIFRSEGKNPKFWNIATDAVINAFLQEDGLPLIKGGVDIPDAINYDAEQMYEMLLEQAKNMPPQQNMPGQSQQQNGQSMPGPQMPNQSGQNSQGESKQQSQDQNGNGTNNESEEKDVGHDTHSMWKQAIEKKHKQEQEEKEAKEAEKKAREEAEKKAQEEAEKEKQEENESENGQSGSDGDKDDQNKSENGQSGSDGDKEDQNKSENGQSGSDGDKDDQNKSEKGQSNSNNENNQNGSNQDDFDYTKNKKPKKDNDAKRKEKELINKLSRMGERETFKQNKIERTKQLEELRKELAKKSHGCGDGTNSRKARFKGIGIAPPLVDWRLLLKEAVKRDVDWSYRNAEIEDGVISSRLEEFQQPETEILLDTSGSISDTLLKNFLRECKNIIQTSKVKVGCFDTKFYGFTELRDVSDIDRMEFVGRGGTNFYAAVNAFTRRVENKIVFTDGCAPMPEKTVDAIWVVFGNTKINPPGGRVIYINDEQLDRLMGRTSRRSRW